MAKSDTDDAADPLEPEVSAARLGTPGLWRRYRRLPRNVVAISLLKLLAGHLSDRRGKRKVFVVFGYVLSSFTRPLLAFAGSWPQVLGLRLSDRVGKGIRTAPRDAMIADNVRVEERGLAFGFYRAMDHTGAVIGPLLGYLLVLWFAADR